MYWGSSNVYPIFGAELDKSRNLTYAGRGDGPNNPAEAYKAMFWLDPYQHGWERFGPNHSDPFKPFMEGAWMTKYNGNYYLQYGAPGTEYNVYDNGTYVGKPRLAHGNTRPITPLPTNRAATPQAAVTETPVRITTVITGIRVPPGLA